MRGGFDWLAAPAGLLADGFVEGDAAVGEGDGADDDGEGVEAVAGLVLCCCANGGIVFIRVTGDSRCILIPLFKRLPHLRHAWCAVLSRRFAGLKTSDLPICPPRYECPTPCT